MSYPEGDVFAYKGATIPEDVKLWYHGELETALFTIEVFDSLGLSDLLWTHKAFVISDSAGLTDLIASPTANKITSDTIVAAEALVLSKVNIILDSMGLGDQALLPVKNVLPQDSISLSELLKIPDASKVVLDAMCLADLILLTKLLRVLDTVASSDLPLVHKQALATDLIEIIEELPSTPEKIKFVADLIAVLESFFDVWKGKWDEPIQELYQSLRDLQTKLSHDREVALKVKER